MLFWINSLFPTFPLFISKHTCPFCISFFLVFNIFHCEIVNSIIKERKHTATAHHRVIRDPLLLLLCVSIRFLPALEEGECHSEGRGCGMSPPPGGGTWGRQGGGG